MEAWLWGRSDALTTMLASSALYEDADTIKEDVVRNVTILSRNIISADPRRTDDGRGNPAAPTCEPPQQMRRRARPSEGWACIRWQLTATLR